MSFFAVGSSVLLTAAVKYGTEKLVNKATSGSYSGSVGSLPYQPLDINQVIADARTTAADNYKNSIALEQVNNPAQAAFRTAATDAATKLAEVGPYTGTPQGTSLLSETADSILQELRLGASLPADVQAQVARAALAKSGQAGLAGSFAQRGLVAQDIGTTGLALQASRQAKAMQAGQILEQLGLNKASLNSSNALGLKSVADSFGLPESGLSPGSIASLYVGNNNAANQVNQNQFLIDQQNANRRNDQLNKILGFGAQYFSGASGSGGTAGFGA